jgi:hypothetical protein
MEGTTGEMKLFHGGAKQALGCWLPRAKFLHFLGCHIGIAFQLRPSKTLKLYFMCCLDPGPDFIRAFSGLIFSEFFIINMWNINKDINTVQQWSAYPFVIARDFS